MANKNWMIYGATGYTGQLIAELAVQRGHTPVLAGRNEAKLRPLAERLDLEYVVFPLPDMFTAVGGLQSVDNLELVLHCAGPFKYTSDPMLKACLQVGAHYLDITGEIDVYENMFLYDEKAQARGIVLMGGVGFDIVPSDCLIKHLSQKLPDATHLEIVIDALGQSEPGESGTTAGTMKSMVEMLPGGNRLRRDGEIIRYDFGAGEKWFTFPHGDRAAMPIPWGDVSTGYRTSGIPNITTYATMPPQQIQTIRRFGYLATKLMSIKPLRDWVNQQIDAQITGPSEQSRDTNRSHIYARVANAKGESAEAWLETVEGYRFTAEAAVRSVEQVLDGNFRGAMTPANAFGPDFVLEIETTERRDSL